jgi:hypothetical protein
MAFHLFCKNQQNIAQARTLHLIFNHEVSFDNPASFYRLGIPSGNLR